jgi:transcriptional regulator with XRE-family HTH domain
MRHYSDVATRSRITLGPTGRQVAANVRRLRTERKMSIATLADRLREANRPIPAIGLTRIETGERRIDVDDLIALANVLDVPLHEMLLGRDGTTDVEVTAWGTVNRDVARWRLAGTSSEAAAKVLALAKKAADELMSDAKLEATRMLDDAVQRADRIDLESSAKVKQIELDARGRADALEREAQKRHHQVVGKLESEVQHLDSQVQNLRAFEREYRTRLKAFVEIIAADPDAPQGFVQFAERMLALLEAGSQALTKR